MVRPVPQPPVRHSQAHETEGVHLFARGKVVTQLDLGFPRS